MEKKQKKEYAKIIILSSLIILFAIMACFSLVISLKIKQVLNKGNVKVGESDLLVHFIKVGQGDSIALRFPNEKVMLIDTGPKESQNTLVEYLKTEVLKNNDDLTIDYVILTHPDLDHSGGLNAVLAEFEVKNFFRPNIASKDENGNNFAMKDKDCDEYNEAIKFLQNEKGINIEILNKEFGFNVGEAYIQIFSPLKVYETTNSMSPIIKVTYNDKKFLFTGDIEEDAEKDMLNKYKKHLEADVLKIAHHGAQTSTSEEFLLAVNPQYAVICVGKNIYGHPNLTTVNKLEANNITVLTTKDDNVVFVCNKQKLEVLDKNKTHSFEFVKFWIIAIIIDVVLITCLISKIIHIKKNNKDNHYL